MFHFKKETSGAAVALLTLSAMLATLSVANAAPTPAPKIHMVVINKMAFGPAPSGVRVGDVVEWVNKDLFRHTVTAPDKRYSVDLVPGATARTRITKSGAIDYYCIFHPGMKGRIVAAE